MRVAIPTNSPGGLSAERSDHFGHCDIFTMVEIDENKEIKDVTTIRNGDHEAGGCMVPVKILQDAGAEAIIVGGMGARPMRGFVDAGITVYFADRSSMNTVQDVVRGLTSSQLPVMHADQVCKGSGNCHH
ncbi:MAG: NifB/NifX family molybdenum-iron cluster-binding protein [Desulforhopalus sp.]